MLLYVGCLLALWHAKLALGGHTCIHDEIADEMKDIMQSVELPYGYQDPVDYTGTPIKRRLDTTASYSPLRINFDTTYITGTDPYACQTATSTIGILSNPSYACGSNDILTADKKSFILNTLIPQTRAWYANTLSVIPPTGNIVTSGFQCGSTSLPAYSYACCTNQLPSYVTSGGVPNADVVIMVTARPAASSSIIAWATSCMLDQYSRPILGQINFAPAMLSSSASAREAQLATALHEMAHALGFSSSLYNYYRQPGNGAVRTQVVETIPTTDPANFLGRQILQIVTPTVVQKAMDHFGCTNWPRPGLELEDGGASGTAGSHWEKRILENEYMTGTSNPHSIISTMTLALFADMGWYNVNFESAQYFSWGRNQGCVFVTSKCSAWSSLPRFYCTSQYPNTAAYGCSDDYVFKAFCSLQAQSSSIPANERYFTDITLGGNVYPDYCPRYAIPVTDGDCRDSTTSTDAFYGENKGSTAKCFMGTHQIATSGDPRPRCHAVDCTTYKVNVGGTWVQCPTAGGSVSLLGVVPTFVGSLNCAPFKDVCPNSSNLCPNDCSGNGNCLSDGTCACNAGQTGADCSLFTCPQSTSDAGTLQQCSGATHGTCDSTTGTCHCLVQNATATTVEKRWSGSACDQLLCPTGATAAGQVQCSGSGTCDPKTGTCACNTNFFGTRCESQHCPSYDATNKIECSNQGSCDLTTGGCSCNYQTCTVAKFGHCPFTPPIPYYGGLACQVPMTGNRYTSLPVNLTTNGTRWLHGTAQQFGTYYYQASLGVITTDVSITIKDITSDVDVFASFVIDPPSTSKYTWSSTRYGSLQENIIVKQGYTSASLGQIYVAVFGKQQSTFTIGVEQDPCSIAEFAKCSGHGQCRVGSCQCSARWSGTQCESPSCLGTPQCSNHGNCVVPPSTGIPTCLCAPGWTQEDCSKTMPSIKSITALSATGGNGNGTIEIGQWAFFTVNLKDITGLAMSVSLATDALTSGADPMLFARPDDLPSVQYYTAFDAVSWNNHFSGANLVIDVPSNLRVGQWFIGVYNSLYGVGTLSYKISVSVSSACPVLLNNCNGHGVCHVSSDFTVPTCSCSNLATGNLTYTGPQCSNAVTKVSSGVPVVLPDIPVGGWSYASVEVTTGRELLVELERLKPLSGQLPLLMVRRGLLPELDSSAFIDFVSLVHLSNTQTVKVTGTDFGAGTYFIGVHNRFFGTSSVSTKLTVTVSSTLSPIGTCADPTPTCSSSNCNCNGRCFVTGGQAQCSCDQAWTGPTCSSPVLRSLSSLQTASQQVDSICNLCQRDIALVRGAFKIYRIPQPLGLGAGLNLTVRPFNNSGGGDVDLYIAEQLPRSMYDFRFIQASDSSNGETIKVTEKSSSGRFWLAIYAKNEGSYTVAVTRDQIAVSNTDKNFLQEVWKWLTETSGGRVAGIIAVCVASIAFIFCFTRFCCCSKDENKDFDQVLQEIQSKGTESLRDLFGVDEAGVKNPTDDSMRIELGTIPVHADSRLSVAKPASLASGTHDVDSELPAIKVRGISGSADGSVARSPGGALRTASTAGQASAHARSISAAPPSRIDQFEEMKFEDAVKARPASASVARSVPAAKSPDPSKRRPSGFAV